MDAAEDISQPNSDQEQGQTRRARRSVWMEEDKWDLQAEGTREEVVEEEQRLQRTHEWKGRQNSEVEEQDTGGKGG